jgi:dienelactone hydrolase
MDDMSDFWDWLRNGFQHELTKLKPGIEADLSKVAVEGASAGGCLAVLSGFHQPPGSIKAVLAAYPGLIPSEKKEKAMMGASTIPVEFLEEYLNNMKPGEIVTSADPPARMKIALALTQQYERKAEFWGLDENLYPFKVLEKIQDAPYMLILHGEDDTAVSVNNSTRFAELAKKKLGDNKIDLIVQPGEHGFDAELAGDTPWLKEGLVKVTELWLGKAGS